MLGGWTSRQPGSNNLGREILMANEQYHDMWEKLNLDLPAHDGLLEFLETKYIAAQW